MKDLSRLLALPSSAAADVAAVSLTRAPTLKTAALLRSRRPFASREAACAPGEWKRILALVVNVPGVAAAFVINNQIFNHQRARRMDRIAL